MVWYKTTNVSSELEGDNCSYVGDFKRALCWYNRALEEDPKNVGILIKKGNTLVIMHRYENAYKSYVKAFIHAEAFDLIEAYVDRYPTYLQNEIFLLKDLLAANYHIHITLEGLNVLLDKFVKERIESKQREEWYQFKNSLEKKHLASLDDVIYIYLKRFGEKFYVHILSFYCYLYEQHDFAITKRLFTDTLIKQMDKIKFENFEHFLKSGRKQPFLDKMTADEFVDFIADFFQNKGYIVRKNAPSYDFGVDLIVDKFGETTSIQLKFKKDPAGISSVQEVHGGRDYYHTRDAMVISVGGFTKSAVKMANRLGVTLWDKKKLIEHMTKPLV